MYELMLALTVAIFLAVGTFYLRHPAASMFHPMTYYLLFHGLVFTVRPIFAYFYDFHGLYDAIGFQPTPWDKTVALICANLALLAFSTVCLSLANQAVPFRDAARDGGRREELLRGFAPVAIVLGMIGTYALFSNFQNSLTIDLSDIRKIDSRTGAGYLVGASGYVISLPMLLVSLVALIPYLARFRWWSMLPFGMFTLMKLAGGGRGQVVTAAVMIGLLYMLDNRRRWPKLTIVPIVLAGYLAFSAVGADRGMAIRQTMGVEEPARVVRERPASKPLETMDLANMEFLEYIVWAVPERTGGFEYFVHTLQIFTEPIPRSLWSEKPIGPPIRMIELYRYARPLGATASVPGAGWVGAGFVGVVLWAGLFALIYGGAYRIFTRGNGGTVATFAYVVFVSTSVIAFRDGVLMSILKALQFYFVPVLALAATAYYLRNSGTTQQRLAGDASVLSGDARERRRLRAANSSAAPMPALAPQPAALELDTPRGRRMARAAQRS